jgi:flagellar motor switch/type III secretory pathway protein FliN
MLMSASLGLTDIKHIDPERAQIAQIMLALLEQPSADDAHEIAARLAVLDGGDWAVCGQHILLRICITEGVPCIFHKDRLAEMVTALDAAETLIAQIENRTGIALEPAATVSAVDEDALVFEIATTDRQSVVQMALLPGFMLPPAAKIAFDALAIDWTRVPISYEVHIAGPMLTISSAAGIDVGDLLIIGGVTSARIGWAIPNPNADMQNMVGRYDLLSGTFTANRSGVDMNNGEMSGTAPPDFSVPLTIRLPNRSATAADLSAMRVGTTFHIGAVTQGLAVSVLVADQEIARGELVQVGDQFAVLIEHKVVHAQGEPVQDDNNGEEQA